jgi:hypothetical protein
MTTVSPEDSGRLFPGSVLEVTQEGQPCTVYVWEGGTHVRAFHKVLQSSSGGSVLQVTGTSGEEVLLEEVEGFSSGEWGNGGPGESKEDRETRIAREKPKVAASIIAHIQDEKEVEEAVRKRPVNVGLVRTLVEAISLRAEFNRPQNSGQVLTLVIEVGHSLKNAWDFCQELKEFSDRCEEEQETDVGDLWDLLSRHYTFLSGGKKLDR